jgi:undecaprenyl-diphosphatase
MNQNQSTRRMASWRHPIRKLRALGHELPALMLFLMVIGLIWLFVEIADAVGEPEAHPFDQWLILAMRNPQDPADPLGPEWVEELGRDFTALGGMGVLTFITLAVSGYLWLIGRYRTMALVLIAVAGGALLSFGLKSGFDRPRPELVPYGAYVRTASFPSAHSTMSAVTYLTLGALLARIHPRRRTRVYILSIAALATFAVGLSRVYMGVHWPSDVLGGWTLGAAWALLCWMIARWMQMHGRIEQNPETE